jgi:hypothetical protein
VRSTFEHKLGFTFGLAQKGYLRFPREHLVGAIGAARTRWAPDEAGSMWMAKQFIDTFLVEEKDSLEIDLSGNTHAPLLHSSTDDHVYIDLLLIADFLVGLVDSGKQWYASQHGDRFVLALKRWVEQSNPLAIDGARRPVALPGTSARSDIDLLVVRKRTLIVVECKAYAKSREFLRGAPGAIAARRRVISKAVRQAERIADAFSSQITRGETEFSPDTHVEWLVCTPTQEFLVPLGEYGFAAPGVPRVITPEELIIFLNDELD